jgi:hypothetical protein
MYRPRELKREPLALPRRTWLTLRANLPEPCTLVAFACLTTLLSGGSAIAALEARHGGAYEAA